MFKWVVDSVQVREEKQEEFIIQEEYYTKRLLLFSLIPIWSKDYSFTAKPEEDEDGNIKKPRSRKIGF